MRNAEREDKQVVRAGCASRDLSRVFPPLQGSDHRPDAQRAGASGDSGHSEHRHDEQSARGRRRIFTLISLAVFLILFVAGTAFLAPPIVKTVQDPYLFREFIDSYGFWGRLVFIGIQILQVVFALIPGEVIEVGSGYAFGMWEGSLLCMAGVMVASMSIFLLVRRYGTRVIDSVYSGDKLKNLKFLHNQKQLSLIVFFLFLIPGTPKDLLTYFVGLTPMKPGTFLLITTIARIPSIVSSAFAGAQLNERNYAASIIVFAVTFVFSAAGFLLYRFITSRREQHKNS